MRGFRRKVAIYVAVASSLISAATAAWAGSHELDCSQPIPPLQLCRGSNQTCQPQAVPPFNDNNDTLKFVNAPPGTQATIVTTYSAANGDNGKIDIEDALNASLSPGPGIYDYTPGQTRTFIATNTSTTQNKFNVSINITNFGTEPQFLTVNITCHPAPPTPGTIIISKIATNTNGTFSFSGDLGSFSIATTGSPGTGSQTFSNVAPGTYHVSEVVPAGWTLNGITCGTGGSGSGVTATIVLPPGGTVECSFTNTKNATTGSITIAKQSNGGNGTFTFNASGSIGPTITITTSGGSGSTPGSGNVPFTNLAPGTYTVSEVVPTGWTFDSVSCVGDLGGTPTSTSGTTATIGLDAGENITCTFINSVNPVPATGSITIVKETNGADSTFSFNGGSLGNFSITTHSGAGSEFFDNLTPGTYTVSEIVPAQWQFVSLTCTGDTGGTPTFTAGMTATIGLDAGEKIVCTYVNKSAAPGPASLTIVKQSNGGNGTFTFNASGSIGPTITITTSGSTGSTPGSGTTSFVSLAPGTYTITEVVPAGWTFDSVSCIGDLGGTPTSTSGTTATVGLDAGENITCTFINSINPGPATGSITIVKQTDGADSTFGFAGTLGSFAVTTHGGAGSQFFDNMAPGIYTVSEIVPAQWQFVSLTCTGDTGGTPTSTAGMTATIGLDAGEKIVCTYVNKSTFIPPKPGTAAITIIKQTNGRDNSFTFTSTIAGHQSFTLTTVDGSAGVTFDQITIGTYTITEGSLPTGWSLTSLSCIGASSAINNVGSRTTTITVVSGAAATCTFINTFDEGFIRQRTSEAIRNFMNRRADILTSEEPDRNRYIRRLSGSLWGDPGSSSSNAPFSFAGSSDAGFGQMSFGTSLSQIANSMVTKEKGAKTTMAWNQDIDVWFEGHYNYYQDRTIDGSSGHFGLLYFGADYLVTPRVLVGALVQYDIMGESSGSTGIRTNGTGWMAGPYFSARLSSNLFIDGRVAWGKSNNTVSPFGTYSDPFETTRALARLNLTGNWVTGPIRITPSVGVTYFTEKQDSYTDSLGVYIPSQSISLGRMTFGPEFAYRYGLDNGWVVEPTLATTGIWDFQKDGTMTVLGIPTSTNAVRAKVTGGAILTSPQAFNARLVVSYDGIGDQHLSVYGAQLWLNSHFPAAGTPVKQPHEPPFSWTGFYIGAHAGFGASDHRQDFSFGGQDAPGAVGAFDQQTIAFISGVQFGYNYQQGSMVYGVEADAKWPSLNPAYRTVFIDPVDSDDQFRARSRLELGGSLRGRVGYTWRHALFYGTAGLAIGRVRTEIMPDGGADADLPATVYSNVATRIGWTAGVGLEYAITNNVLGRVEYRYTDYGQSSFTIADPLLLPSYGPNVATQSLVLSEWLFGLDYKF